MTNEEIRLAIAESELDRRIAAEGWVPCQRQDRERLYGGGTSFGLWIYKGADGQLHGINYDTEQQLRIGEVTSIAQRNNYPEDLNAILPLLPRGINIYLGKDGEWYVGTMQEITPGTVNPSLALAACEFYLKWKGLWKE